MMRTIWLWAAAGVLLYASARGAELPETKLAGDISAPLVADWIEQLDRPGFVERQAASQQLEEAGIAALSQLEAAAISTSREASARALDILKRHLLSGTDELKLAARDVLLRLAQNDNASTAQRARNVLNPPKEPGAVTPVGFQPGILPPPINNFGGGPRGNLFNGNFGAIMANAGCR